MELKDMFTIREVRTFMVNKKCECGGIFVYNPLESGVSDIFGSLFASMHYEGNSEAQSYKFNHKCNQCGKQESFTHRYPYEKKFEIGLDTKKEDIVTFVATALAEDLQEDIKDAE